MKLNYDEMLRYQKFWKESKNLSEKRKEALISLSNKLISKAKENGDELGNVVLLYPEDCSNFRYFMDFAFVMDACVYTRKKGGAKMCGWFQNKNVDVE